MPSAASTLAELFGNLALLGLATVTGDLQTLACLIFLGRLWTLSQWGASQIQTLRPQGHVAFRLVNRVRHAILLQAETWHRFVGGRRMTSSCYPAFCNLLQLQLSSNCLATWPLFGLATVTGDLQTLACLIFLGRLWTLSQWGASQIQTLRPQGHVAFRLVNRVRHAILLQAETWHRFVGGRRMTSSCYPAFCNLLQLQLSSNCLATWPLFGLATVTGDLQTLACLIFLGHLRTLSQWRASQIQTLRPQGHVAFQLVNRVRHAVLLQAETSHRFVGGRRVTCSCHPAFSTFYCFNSGQIVWQRGPFSSWLADLAWLIFLEHLWTLSQWTSPVTTLPGMLPALPRLAFVIVCFA